MKIQLTIALSRLRSDSSDTRKCNDAYLKRSLITLQNYAENDKELASTRFPEQVSTGTMNFFKFPCLLLESERELLYYF